MGPASVGRRSRRAALSLAAAVLALLVTTVVALAAAGDLDSGFGTGGTVTTEVAPGVASEAELRAVTLDGTNLLTVGSAVGPSGPVGALARYADTGALDAGFGGAFGMAGLSTETQSSRLLGVARQSDGRSVAVGYVDDGVARRGFIARYASNSARDNTFSTTDGGDVTAGYELLSFGGDDAVLEDVAIRSDGRIIATGWSGAGGSGQVVVLCLNADGSRCTFGSWSNGIVTQSFGVGAAFGRALVVLPGDGVAIAAEVANVDSGGTKVYGVLALTANGAADTSFDGDGRAQHSAGAGDAFAADIVRQADGSLVVGGSGSATYFLRRFSATGVADTGFGSSGLAFATPGGTAGAHALAQQADGKLLLAGYSTPPSLPHAFAVARFSAGGALDTGFGSSGFARASFGTADAIAHDVAVDGLGRIVLVGLAAGGDQRFALARFLSDGTSGGGTSGGGGGAATAPTTSTGAAPTAPPASAPPLANAGAPVVRGAAWRRGTLEATPGTWRGAPTSYSYAWEQCIGSDPRLTCAPAPSAGDGPTYAIPKKTSLGLVFRVSVTAKRGDETAGPVASAPTRGVREFRMPDYRPAAKGRSRTFRSRAAVERDLRSRDVCLLPDATPAARYVELCGDQMPVRYRPDGDRFEQLPSELRDEIGDGDVFAQDPDPDEIVRPGEQLDIDFYDEAQDPPGGRCELLQRSLSRDDAYVILGNVLDTARARLKARRCTAAEDTRVVVTTLNRPLVTGVELNRTKGLITLAVTKPDPCSDLLLQSGAEAKRTLAGGTGELGIGEARTKLKARDCRFSERSLGERERQRIDLVESIVVDRSARTLALQVTKAKKCDYLRLGADEAMRRLGRDLAVAIDRLDAQNCAMTKALRTEDGSFDDYVEGVDVGSDRITLRVVAAKAPACQQELRFGPIVAEGTCLHREGLTWTSSAQVKVGGLKLVPNGAGAKIILDPLNLRIAASGRAKVTIGPATLLKRTFPETVLYEGSFDWTWQGAVDPALTNSLMDWARNRLPGGGAPPQGLPARIVNLPDFPRLPQITPPGFPDVKIPDFSKVRLPKELADFANVDTSRLKIPSLNDPRVEIPTLLIPKVQIPPLCFNTAGNPVFSGAPFSGKACAQIQEEGVALSGEAVVPMAAGATARASLFVFRDGRVRFDSFRAAVGSFDVGPLTVKGATLEYQGDENRWHGEGAAALFDKGPDTARVAIAASFDVIDNQLRNASFQAEAPGVLGVPIGPTGIFMIGIGARYDSVPAQVVGGRGVFGFGPEVNGVRLAKLDAGLTYEFGPRVLTIDGKLYVLNNEAANATLRFTPTEVRFRGGFGTKFERDLGFFGGKQKFSIGGEFGGFIAGSKFQLDGDVRADLNGNFINAEGTVSNLGIAACVTSKGAGSIGAGPIKIDWKFEASGGIGYLWKGEVKPFGGGSCGMKDFRVAPKQNTRVARAAQARGARTVTLRAGLSQTSLMFQGAGGPPKVVLTGPGGVTISTPADLTPVSEPRYAILQDDEADTTTIMLARPAGGTWTATPRAGSTIADLATADPQPAVAASTRVTGRGRARVLRYRVKAIPGQTVTFRERGAGVEAPIGRPTTAARGSIRFRPAVGPRGRRTIIAAIEQDGLPREERVVARYVAPGPLVPGRPARVRIRRGDKGSSVRVSWTGVRGARGYVAMVTFNDGAKRRVLLGARTRTMVVTGVRRGRPVRVSVQAVGELERSGRARTVRLASERIGRLPKPRA